MEANELAVKYMNFANSLVREYKPKLPVSYHDDIKSEAYLALVQVANDFDEAMNVKFTTFAKYRILGAMWDFHRKIGLRGYRSRMADAPLVFPLEYEIHDRSFDRNNLESQEYVLSLINRLPKSHTKIFRMIYLERKSFKEAATLLGITQQKASYLHRTGLEKLRIYLRVGDFR